MRVGLWWVDIYTLRIAGAVLIAMAWLIWMSPGRRDIHERHLGWWLLLITLCALVFGRAGYIAENAGYFRQHPDRLLRLRQTAGLHGMTALLGGLLGTVLWARASGHSLWDRLTCLAPPALFIAAGAWWACQHVGCAAGRPLSNPANIPTWLAVEAPNLYHAVTPRYPVQSLGLVWGLLTAGLAWFLHRKGAAALPLYLAGATGLTLLKAQAVPTLLGIRTDTWSHAALGLIGIGYTAFHLEKAKRVRSTHPA
ncbi:MAG: prolipoprotein diacylglyceryl transferase family protein [Anaerolineae bacterium]